MNKPLWIGRFFFMVTGIRDMPGWHFTPHPSGGQVNISMGWVMFSFGAPPSDIEAEWYAQRQRISCLKASLRKAHQNIDDRETEICRQRKALDLCGYRFNEIANGASEANMPGLEEEARKWSTAASSALSVSRTGEKE